MNFWVKNFLFILLFELKHLPSDYTTLLITAGQCFHRRRINMAMETGVTVICVSPCYVCPRTHITSDMCFPGKETQNTEARYPSLQMA